MERHEISRRALLQYGGAAVAGLTVLQVAGPAHAFPAQSGEQLLPWLDQPTPNPVPEVIGQQLQWEALDSWLTPSEQFFTVKHYNQPLLREEDWRLTLAGLVARPGSITLPELKARARREVTFTLECSGNSGLPFFSGGIGNARWAGTPLAPLLAEAGILAQGSEVVFWGSDAGEETVRELKITEHMARSMALSEALNPDNLLCYEMNGAALPPEHGFPVRLIVPGWYGVANTKWLSRIEVRDRRYQGRFMARDYVTIREESRDGEMVWTFSSVSRGRLKSAPARVTQRGDQYSILGAAWGAPIARVEVQIDGGAWRAATLSDGQRAEFAWTFWTLAWPTPAAGVHTITSRAIDADGNLQPAPDDPQLAGKKTFWESNGHITRRVAIP